MRNFEKDMEIWKTTETTQSEKRTSLLSQLLHERALRGTKEAVSISGEKVYVPLLNFPLWLGERKREGLA